MSLGYVIEMDKTFSKYGSEIRSLIAQLYERCGRGDKRSAFEPDTLNRSDNQKSITEHLIQESLFLNNLINQSIKLNI